MVREITQVQFCETVQPENQEYPYYYFTKEKQRTEIVNAIVEFYLIEEILSKFPSETFLMERKKISNLFIDLIFMRKELSEKLARALFDYLCLASLGEARHSNARGKGYYLGKFEDGNSREMVYEQAYKFAPSKFLPKLLLIFNTGNWSHSYGGLKWAKIVKAAMLYEKVSNQIFVDHIIDLAHNGGTAFDKNCVFVLTNRDVLTRVLDTKFTCSGITNAIKNNLNYVKITPQLKEIALRLGTKIFSVSEITCLASVETIELGFPVPTNWGNADIVIKSPVNNEIIWLAREKNEEEDYDEPSILETLFYSKQKIQKLKLNLLDFYNKICISSPSEETCKFALTKLNIYKENRKEIMKQKKLLKKKGANKVLETILEPLDFEIVEEKTYNIEADPAISISKQQSIFDTDASVKEEINGRLP